MFGQPLVCLLSPEVLPPTFQGAKIVSSMTFSGLHYYNPFLKYFAYENIYTRHLFINIPDVLVILHFQLIIG